MKKLFLAMVIFCSFLTAQAEESVWRKAQGQGQLIYTLYSESGFWNVNLYLVNPGELQELQWHKAFSTKEKATAFLAQFLSEKELKFPHSGADYADHGYVFTEDSNEVVWKSENQWSWDWEIKYHQWLKANFHKNFYLDNNVATDCADGATAIRWIFSRIHKLPAGNRLAGSGIVFTNESMKEEWKKLPTDEDWRKDKRFIAALDYVLDNTYTHTVIKDGYPIAIDKTAFLAGTYMVSLQGESGHTLIISYVANEANGQIPIRVLSSTGGRIVRPLYEQPFMYDQPKKGESGILRPRWPFKSGNAWDLVPPEKMPHYSVEQFDPKFPGQLKDFMLAVYDRIVPGFKPEQLVTEGIDQLFKKFPERAKYVKEGYEFCRKNGCPEGTPEWEEWSTPMRDKGLLDYFNNLEKIVGLISQLNYSVQTLWNEALAARNFKVNDIETTLKQLLFIWRFNLYDSNPNVPINQRWAIYSNEASQAMVHRISYLLTHRADLVAKNLESAEADNEIQRFYFGYVQYCQIFSFSCDHLRQVLREKTLTFGDLTLNIAAWLERSLWFNSDTRVATEYRWGKIQSEVIPIHGLFNHNSIISKNEILLGGNDDERLLFDLRSRKALNIPSDFVVEDLEVSQGYGLLINQSKKQIGVLEPRTQKFVAMGLPEIPLKFRWLGPQTIIGKAAGGVMYAVRFSDQKFSSLTPIESIIDDSARLLNDPQFRLAYESYWRTAPKNMFYANHYPNRFTIYDFSGAEVLKTSIKHVFSNKAPTEYLGVITHVSKTHYVILVTKNDEKCPDPQSICQNYLRLSYAVEKGTGKVTKFPYRVGKYLGKNNYILEIQAKNPTDQEVFIAELDDSFAIQKRLPKIGTSFHFNESPNITLWTGNAWEAKVVRVKEDLTVEELFTGSQKMFPQFLAPSHLLVAMQSSGGIYDFAQKKIVFKQAWVRAAELYNTERSPWFFAGDGKHSGIYRFTDSTYMPLVTGLSTYLANNQACGARVKMPVGATFDFTAEYNAYEAGYCVYDRNDSDGAVFNMTGGRAYYLPSSAGVKVREFTAE